MLHNKINHFNPPKMGLGCINLTEVNSNIIDIAMEKNCYFFDTADCYGNGESEIILGKKLQSYQRTDFVLCTKVGVYFDEKGIPHVNGSADYIKQAVQASLQRLLTDYIDLLYLHRVDPNVPIEESMMVLKQLVISGKIKHVGLSEVTANQIRRAHKVCAISAVQIEYSPWSREDENNNVITVCHELNIQVIAYSPLGRAIFTDTDQAYFKKLPAQDFRQLLPRYKGDMLQHNLIQRAILQKFAQDKKCSLAQLVLAWVMNKGFIPIPATTNPTHFEENFSAMQLKLTETDYKEIDEIISAANYCGSRYPNETISAIYPEKSNVLSFSNKIINISIGVSVSLIGFFAYQYLKNNSNKIVNQFIDKIVPNFFNKK